MRVSAPRHNWLLENDEELKFLLSNCSMLTHINIPIRLQQLDNILIHFIQQRHLRLQNRISEESNQLFSICELCVAASKDEMDFYDKFTKLIQRSPPKIFDQLKKLTLYECWNIDDPYPLLKL